MPIPVLKENKKIWLWIEKKLKRPNPLWIIFTSFFRLIYFFMYLSLINRKKNKRDDLHTICIGNITLGGNGKTPFLMRLIQDLYDIYPSVFSKGYGRKIKKMCSVDENSTYESVGDEPIVIHKNFPLSKVVVGNNRNKFIHAADKGIWLFDDGLQNYGYQYDHTVAVIDKINIYQKKYLIPTGMFREPLSRLKNVDLIGVKGNISNKEFSDLKKYFLQKQILTPICSFRLKPLKIFSNNYTFNPEQPFAAFCGIGNPDSFFDNLNELNLSPIEKYVLPDHQTFNQKEWNSWNKKCREKGVNQWICTQKDFIKFPQSLLKNDFLFFLDTEIIVEHGKNEYIDFLNKVRAVHQSKKNEHEYGKTSK